MAIITLMSDFGTRDHYVACMKGVILQIHPKAAIVDVTHEIEPHGIIEAAFVLRQVWAWFPPESVHVVVVDPGVGTSRRILVGRYSERFVVAPDNGLITLVHHDARLEELRVVENRRYFAPALSTTFHGRDVMAPVAAHIARGGVRLHELGPTTDHLEILDLPRPKTVDASVLTGQVLYVDRFGNLITNISAIDINSFIHRRASLTVYLGDRAIGPICATYGEVPPGMPVAVIGSTQLLEIAINRGSAARTFGADVGAPVALR